ncbi:MAG: hypothetical protein ACQEW9_11560 [Bacteroidota bacterium]
MTNTVFKETQRFRQVWIWIILLVATAVTLIAIFNSVISSDSTLSIILPLMILALVILLFLSMKLEIKIDSQSLSYSFFPLIKKRLYSFNEIQSLQLIKFNPLWKYGGWGIRYNFDHWAYNVGGNMGILVTTKSNRFLLGTQKPNEAQRAINRFNEAKQNHHAG